jgi:serine-type D-Ala-D-Ala carboxypeptidase (penicillin-binding protein 5/6)
VRALTLSLMVLLGACSAGTGVALAQQPAAQPGPSLTSRAAAVIDAASGALLYAHRPFDELPPASLTKMVTALVALERGSLEQRVEPRADYDVEPILIGIGAGDSLRLEDALYGLLLNSGNDAGVAIAESVGGGSVARFVGWMNELSRRLGLEHTRFLNPHGLDQPGHVSSAYDMAIVGRALMKQPVLARIVGERRRVVEGPPRWLFQTTNPLLGVYAGVDGVKTGYDTLAGRCLVATAVRDGRRAIAVVMNSDRHAAEAAALLDAAFADPSWGGPATAPGGPATPAGHPKPGAVRADLDGAAHGVPRSVFRALRGDAWSGRAG